MRVSSELVVGNALLAAVEEGMETLDFKYFTNYHETLVAKLKNKHADVKSSCLSTYEVMDVAYSVRPYVTFDLPRGYRRFRDICIDTKHEKREALKRKLNIYYRKLTPDWMLEEI